jgi:hypothetical protein
MTNEIRKRFCVRCGRRVDLDEDIGAIELTDGSGIMCGTDVDKLIAEIYVPQERIAWQRMPARFERRREFPVEAL